jgi:hypothetical protein
MRKIGAFGLAAFYLLLTTGIYVCLLHCSAAYVFSGPQTAMHQTDADGDGHHKAKSDKKCHGDEDCDCCNKHGSYVIKENINSSFEFQAIALQLALTPHAYQDAVPVFIIITKKIVWPDTTGPPGRPSPPLYIYHHSLLI